MGSYFPKEAETNSNARLFWGNGVSSGVFQASFANLGKWLLPMADPDGHRHRLVGCQEARALASALGCARIGHSDTLQSLMPSHLSLTLPVRSRSRAAELENKRCCSRVSHDAFDPLSSTSYRRFVVRSHLSSAMVHQRATSPAGPHLPTDVPRLRRLADICAALSVTRHDRTFRYGAAWIVLTICRYLTCYITRIRSQATALVALSDPVPTPRATHRPQSTA